MSGVLRADLRRITTTKLWWVALICIFVLSAGYAALPATVAWLQGRAGVATSPFNDPGIIRSIYNGGNVLSRILAMVVGIVAIGSEYRYGTLAASYLATPRRVRMLLGKAGALLIFGLIYVRWRRVGPLIVAHTLLDITAFVGYALVAPHVSWL